MVEADASSKGDATLRPETALAGSLEEPNLETPTTSQQPAPTATAASPMAIPPLADSPLSKLVAMFDLENIDSLFRAQRIPLPPSRTATPDTPSEPTPGKSESRSTSTVGSNTTRPTSYSRSASGVLFKGSKRLNPSFDARVQKQTAISESAFPAAIFGSDIQFEWSKPVSTFGADVQPKVSDKGAPNVSAAVSHPTANTDAASPASMTRSGSRTCMPVVVGGLPGQENERLRQPATVAQPTPLAAPQQPGSLFGPASQKTSTTPELSGSTPKTIFGSTQSIFGTPASTPFATATKTPSTTPWPTLGETVIDPSGDALVHFNCFSRPFLVSSKAFALLCKPWANMIKYHRWGSGEHKTADRIDIDLTGDDQFALGILLHIAHLQFDKVPRRLSMEELLALSVLTDKYEATRAVIPWISNWLSVWREATLDAQIPKVWIAWEFGLAEDFKRVAAALVLDAEIEEVAIGPTRLLYKGNSLPANVPPDLEKTVLSARHATLSKLINIAYLYLDQCHLTRDQASRTGLRDVRLTASSSSLCRCNPPTDACHVIICGSILMGLQPMGLSPLNILVADYFTHSINELAAVLQGLKVFQYWTPEYRLHTNCDPTSKIRARVKEVLETVPTTLAAFSPHKPHLQKRSNLLYPKDPARAVDPDFDVMPENV